MVFLEVLNTIAHWVFLNSLKASLLIIIIFTIQFFLRNRLSARWRYSLWLLLIIRLLLPAKFESELSVFNLFRTNNEILKSTSDIFSQPAWNMLTSTDKAIIESKLQTSVSLSFVDIFMILWLIGSIVLVLYTIIGNIRFIRKINQRQSITNPNLTQLFSHCLKKMSINRHVRFEKLDSIQIPMLYGWVKPTIFLPANQITNWTPNQLKHIICHELAHYKCQDILIAHICTILQVLHWFNPLIWFAFYKIRQDREVACDAIALNHLGQEQAKSYGSTLISLLENISMENLMPMTVGIAESKKNLKRRLIQITRFRKPKLVWIFSTVTLIILISFTVFTERMKDSNKKTTMILEKYKQNLFLFEESGLDGQLSELVTTGDRYRIKLVGKNFKSNIINRQIISLRSDSLSIFGYPLVNDTTKLLRIVGENVNMKLVGEDLRIEAEYLIVDTLTISKRENTSFISREQEITDAVLLAKGQVKTRKNIDRLLVEGDSLYTNGEYIEAILRFKQVIKFAPNNRKAKKMLVNCLIFLEVFKKNQENEKSTGLRKRIAGPEKLIHASKFYEKGFLDYQQKN